MKYTECLPAGRQAFTIIEVLVVLVIFITLMGIGYVSVIGYERRAPISATVNTFIADMRETQTKAMSGINQSGYSISVTGYTVPANISITTAFPGGVINFEKGTGDILGFSDGNNIVTITQTLSGEKKILTINRYGAVTQIQ